MEHVDSHLATDGIELSADVLDRIDEIVPPESRSTSPTTCGASARQRWRPHSAAGGATAPGRSDVNSPRNRRTWSGEQQFDANGGIAGGHLAVERYQRGVASLGKGCQVVIGPQLVALVVTRGDRTPDRIQFGWLIGPSNALVSPELIVGSPCLAAVDGIVAHDGGVGQQPEQPHLCNPAEDDVVRFLAEPVRRDRMVDVTSPNSCQPYANVHQLHCDANLSTSSASNASAMSSLVTRTVGVASRAISGSVTRPVFPFRVAGRPTSRATARLTRSLRLSPSSAARAFAARMRVGEISIVVRIKAY